ncbi:MAG: hypothetical protein H9855_02550 [Candidatus Acinetobacter avistercoris]|nr:hypothetical protein [Candidatus Acinetobacter avistercoris]
MIMKPTDDQGEHQDGVLGTIATLSQLLANEYAISGYSLTEVDIEIALCTDFILYSGWATSYVQEQKLETTADATQIISFNDWSVLETLVRAHCELIQAQRVEGTGSLGGERFGLSVSEASQNYINAKAEMKKEAYIEPPFTF